MLKKGLRAAMGAGAVLALAAPGALAQKSEDTIRLGITDVFDSISPYHTPQIEGNFFYGTLYEPLVTYNSRTGKFEPTLAKAWRRIDPKTLEFDLRDDIVFHNGHKMDAEDVVHIVNFAADPKSRLRLHSRYLWIKEAQKLGPYKVRVVAKRPYAVDLLSMSKNVLIFDSELHKSLKNKSDYGRQAVGTGAIRMVSFDKSQGVVVERVDNHPRQKINFKRLVGRFIPDRQTQVAHMLAGSLDIMRASTRAIFDQFKAKPGFHAVSRKQHNVLMMNLDARGRAGQKALTDARVRRAIFMAVDRELIAKNLIPGNSEVVDALCFKGEMIACDYDTIPPRHDPAGARKLLAEAGYPNGLELVISGRELPRDAALSVSNDLRKIGIDTSVNIVQQTVYNKLRSQGKMQALVYSSPVGATPDASSPFLQQYASKSRAFVADDDLRSTMFRALGMHDVEKRKALYRKAFRILNEKSYNLPIAAWPDTWITNDDVEIRPGTWNAFFTRAHDLAWR